MNGERKTKADVAASVAKLLARLHELEGESVREFGGVPTLIPQWAHNDDAQAYVLPNDSHYLVCCGTILRIPVAAAEAARTVALLVRDAEHRAEDERRRADAQIARWRAIAEGERCNIVRDPTTGDWQLLAVGKVKEGEEQSPAITLYVGKIEDVLAFVERYGLTAEKIG